MFMQSAVSRLKLQCTLIYFGLLILIPVISHSANLHVDVATGTDTSSCGSEAAVCRSIQQAVDNASVGDTILVAKGTYVHNGNATCSSVICIDAMVITIFGGYPGGSWTSSDPSANLTEIDGEQAHRGISVRRLYQDTSLNMAGFTVKNGATSGANGDNVGGGLKAGNASVTLRDMIFDNNVATGADTNSDRGEAGAGGGVQIASCPPSVVTSTGIPIPPDVLFERVTFLGNKAIGGAGLERGGFALGGGLFVQRANFRGEDIKFDNNLAMAGSSPGGGRLGANERADALGGAAALMFGTDALFQDLEVINNSALGGDATLEGGYAFGGGFYAEGQNEDGVIPGCPADSGINSPQVSLQVIRGDIQNNTATGGTAETGGGGKGGGFTIHRATATLNQVSIINNHGAGGVGSTVDGQAAGGGVLVDDAANSATITNSIIADNTAYGGTSAGGGIRLLAASATISHSTFAGNLIPSGGGVASPGMAIFLGPRYVGGVPINGQATLNYCIFADHSLTANEFAVHVWEQNTITFNGGLFAGNSGDTNDGGPLSGTFNGLGTMISAPVAGFVSPGSPNFDYHLSASSPAISQATTSMQEKDINDQIRGSNTRDIGADERCTSNNTDLLLENEDISSLVQNFACDTITAREYKVLAGGDSHFQAGISVVLENGFTVEQNGNFKVTNLLP